MVQTLGKFAAGDDEFEPLPDKRLVYGVLRVVA
jgi:hypothetical protein